MWIPLLILVISITVGVIVSISNTTGDGISKPKMTTITDYIGGLETILERTKCSLSLYNNYIDLNFAFKTNKNFRIHYKDIVEMTGKNEEQISKDVTITRLLIGGLLAFGAKKEKIRNRKFIIITYLIENKKEQKIVFESNMAELFISKFREVQKWHKDQNNIKDENAITVNELSK